MVAQEFARLTRFTSAIRKLSIIDFGKFNRVFCAARAIRNLI
jgi:hypothetical protein